jgi:hypothetical protein
MLSSALTKVLPGRRAGVALAGTVFAATGLMLASLVAGSASAATTPQPAAGQVAGVSTTAFANINVFYEAANHTLILKSSGPGGTSLGGRLTSGPAAITIGTEFDRTFAFARGTDNAIWYRLFGAQGIWTPWASLGGRALGAPAVSGVGAFTVAPNVWVRGTDGALWQRSQGGGGWFSLGGGLISDPAAVPAVAGFYPPRRDVFAIGRDRAVWEYTSGWHRVGGRSTVAPAAVQLPSGQTDLFARGTDNALWMTTRAPAATAFGAWQRIGGALTSAPTATIFPSTSLRVYALGTDGNLWLGERALSGGPWTWTQVA